MLVMKYVWGVGVGWSGVMASPGALTQPPLPTHPCGAEILSLRLESVFKFLDVYQLTSQYFKGFVSL